MIFSEINIHPEVQEADFKRFLRFPPFKEFEGPVAENAAWARAWYGAHGRPWWCADFVAAAVEPGSGVLLEGERFGGARLSERFAGAAGAALVAASAGPEAEAEAAACFAAGEPDRYYFLECYAAAVVEALLAGARRRLAAWAGTRDLAPMHHYCPGFPDWSVADAPRLLALLRAGREFPGPLDTLPSGMLRPKKSQVAAVGFSAAVSGERARGAGI
jgi:hypothetical protein